jgi:formylglycine-generating enzyme required for sulfatase activity
MNTTNNLKYILSFSLIIVLINSCGMPKAEDFSVTTGWAINWQQNGGFEAKLKNSNSDENSWNGTKIPSNMVFVQGGTFVMGKTQEDVMRDGNNIQKEATVSSFWMDQTEITNIQYREYTDWLKRVFWDDGQGDFSFLYAHSLPDSTVWRNELSFNEPMVNQYFRHPAYQDYPVVGVSWQQAVDYCDWRTDRVNERRIIESGALGKPEKAWKKYKTTYRDEPESHFTTQKYLQSREYDLNNWEKGAIQDRKGVTDLAATEDDDQWKKKLRKIKMEDGMFTSPYRLPTEAEWEYASVAGYNTTVNLDGSQHGKFYPWRSFDADYHQANGSKSGRNSLRQPYDGNTFDIKRQQYGKLRGDNKQNAFINSITDGANTEGNKTFASRSSIEYDNYMMAPTYRDISFEEMRTGQFLANFRHGRGDYSGVSPVNNDLGTMTMPVGSFPPNDWGLYDMAGNVNEWVMDVYRPLTPLVSSDLNPFRGNVFKQVARYDGGVIEEGDIPEDDQARALGLMDADGVYIFPANPGNIVMINEQIDGDDDTIDDNEYTEGNNAGYNVNDENPYNIYKGRDKGENYQYENPNSTNSMGNNQYDSYDYLQSSKSTNPRSSPKRQYNQANNIDYRDGQGKMPLVGDYSGWGEYDYGKTTLINNYTRIYKGGSWQDDAYWLSPGNKRFLNEDLAQSDIGFRCVIDHLGYVSGGEYEGSKKGKNKDRYNRDLWKYKNHDNDNKNIE